MAIATPTLKSKWRLLWRWAKRGVLTLTACIALYALAAIALARIPVNRNFIQPDDGVEIAIVSNGIHVDLALPLTNSHFDWMKHLRREDFGQWDEDYQTASFGWGERAFYLETPTWGEVKPTSVLRAFCGMGSSVMHVDLKTWFPAPSESCRCIRLSPAQYKKLCTELLAAMNKDEAGRLLRIDLAHYDESDAFYEAKGHYHLFHTCNAWAGDRLRNSGIRIGIWTPTTSGVFACLPDQNIKTRP